MIPLSSVFRKYFTMPYSVLPGFKGSMAFTLFYLTIIVLLPLSTLFFTSYRLSFEQFLDVVTDDRVLHAFKITFGLSFIAAVINAVFGCILAWVLVRYRFPFKKLCDAMVDLPFAIPTAVSGIALAALYAPDGLIGQYADKLGFKIAFTPIGIAVALVFIGLPFVVRTVEPVLEDLDPELEEAALSLGASRFQTFTMVLLPQLLPSLLTGFAMAFARALGEYGSVIFIAGNMPYISEILPLLIIIKLEQYDIPAATSIALVMLFASFLMLFVINTLQKWSRSDRV